MSSDLSSSYPEQDALDRANKELDIYNWYRELLNMKDSQTEANIVVKEALKHLPRTETRAGEMIVKKFKHHLSYNETSDTWYFWNGIIHKPCEGTTLVMKIAKSYFNATVAALNVLDARVEEYANTSGDANATRKEYRLLMAPYVKFQDELAKVSGQRSLVSALKTEVDVPNTHFSDDRRWFVIENGVYDMEEVRRTREFRLLPHDASRPVYRAWNFREEVGATHPSLDKFLHGSIEDAGQVKFLQKIVGTACMAGVDRNTRSIVSLQGAQNSGKSMFKAIMEHFGNDGGLVTSPPRLAVIESSSDAARELARVPMRNTRFAGFSEKKVKLDREFLLEYSGFDAVSSREHYKSGENWTAQGVLFFFSNYGMNINKTDGATFDRLKPIHFPHTFVRGSIDPRFEIDPDLQDKIISEGSGFLEWLKEGYLLGLAEGFDCTESMEALKRGERDDDNEALIYLESRKEGGWLYENENAPQSHCVSVMELWADYRLWHGQNGSGKRLERGELVAEIEKIYPKSKSGAKKFVGLLLKPQADMNYSNN